MTLRERAIAAAREMDHAYAIFPEEREANVRRLAACLLRFLVDATKDVQQPSWPETMTRMSNLRIEARQAAEELK